jgi:hypothetical protein
VKLSTRGKFAAGTTIGLAALWVAPVAAQATTGINVGCTGQAGLVAAINTVNAAGGGTIGLATNCHYALTAADNGENGLPVITTPVVIVGRGATIDGTDSVRVLEVDGPDGNLTVQGATITGGSAGDFGGGILNAGGTLTVLRSQVVDNSAGAGGGGIANMTFDPSDVATLTVNVSIVSGNNQTGSPEDEAIGGGGVLNMLGTARVVHSQVDDNTAQGLVGGGIANGDYFNFASSDSVLTLTGTQVNGNVAPNAGGGGIQNLLGSVTVNGSQVNDNTALNGGGISSGSGGAPEGAPTSHLVVNKSQIDGNAAIAPVPQPGSMSGPPIAAGGLANGGSAILNQSEVDNNTASHTSGGGIVNHATMTLNHSRVVGNSAAGEGVLSSGGGIVNADGPPGTPPAVLTLNQSAVDDNSAGGDGGGIANGIPLGGPMPLVGGQITMNQSEVVGNSALHGGGVFNSGGTVALHNSRIVDNTPDNCEPSGTVPGCIG